MDKTIELMHDARTDVGCVRDNNEDNFIVCSNLEKEEWTLASSSFSLGAKGSLLVVADGMGGLNAGEVASAIAVHTVKELFSQIPDEATAGDDAIEEFMTSVIKEADKKIISYGDEHPETAGMGTTIVIGWIIGEKAHIAWCGDSRAYRWHSLTGLHRLSHDHSYVQELVDAGRITEEQAFFHPDSNIITRSLGNKGHEARPQVTSTPLYDGLRLLLCTDGLCGLIQDHDIEKIVSAESDIKKCKEQLIAAAKEAGGHDNVTVVLCDILSGAGAIPARLAAQEPQRNRATAPTTPTGVEVAAAERATAGKSKTKKILHILLIALAAIAVAFFVGYGVGHGYKGLFGGKEEPKPADTPRVEQPKGSPSSQTTPSATLPDKEGASTAGGVSTDKPAGGKPATDKTASDKPVTGKPTADKPATDKSAAEKPAAESSTKPAGTQAPSGSAATQPAAKGSSQNNNSTNNKP